MRLVFETVGVVRGFVCYAIGNHGIVVLDVFLLAKIVLNVFLILSFFSHLFL